MLIPNNKQSTRLFQLAGAARFAYNWALGYENANHEAGNKFVPGSELRKIFTQLKSKNPEFNWLNDISNNVTKQAIKDANTAFGNFFAGRTDFPQFKSKRKTRPAFYMDTDKIQFTDTHVKLEKLTTSLKKNKQKFNWVRLAEHDRIPLNAKYYNPRVTFDGLNWWISVGIECEEDSTVPTNPGIGIDLGIKTLAKCSDTNEYPNINKSNKVKRLEKRKRRLQRKGSRKYTKTKKGDKYCKTRNIIKSEKKLLVLNHRLTNIRHDHLHNATTEIVNRKPKFIVMEDLNVSGMMKNKHLSKSAQEQCFGEFYRQIEYKSKFNNIEFITADRYYPSSKMCSCCGNIKKDLKLSERTYRCDKCGLVIDRDFNASINLSRYSR